MHSVARPATRSEQSDPKYVSAHKHTPSRHTPCPEQALGQGFASLHATPPYPCAHSHLPLWHTPCPLQSLGQGVTGAAFPQSAPVYNGLQRHTPEGWQTPRPLQRMFSPGHGLCVVQSGPLNPGTQRHEPPEHKPRPPQLFWQRLSWSSGMAKVCSHAGPVNPTAQTHWPFWQIPRIPQFVAHGSSQWAPEKPTAHSHKSLASLYTPWKWQFALVARTGSCVDESCKSDKVWASALSSKNE